MATISFRLNEEEEKLFRSYSFHTGKTLSELFKTFLREQIEAHLDYEEGLEAYENFKKNPITHSIDDIIIELENDL